MFGLNLLGGGGGDVTRACGGDVVEGLGRWKKAIGDGLGSGSEKWLVFHGRKQKKEREHKEEEMRLVCGCFYGPHGV